MLQPIRLELQILLTGLTTAGVIDREKKTDLRGAIERFVRYKSSPTISIPFELAEGKDVIGRERTPLQTLLGAISPLVAEEIYETFKYNAILGAVLAPYIILGVSIQTYQKKQGAKIPQTVYEAQAKVDEINNTYGGKERKAEIHKYWMEISKDYRNTDKMYKDTEREEYGDLIRIAFKANMLEYDSYQEAKEKLLDKYDKRIKDNRRK